jgi:small-conductance mechanosensitive channel
MVTNTDREGILHRKGQAADQTRPKRRGAVSDYIQLRGPERAVYLFDTRLVGLNADNAKKFLFTLSLIAVMLLLGWVLRVTTRRLLRGSQNERAVFWTRQGIRLFVAVFLVLGIASIWFDDPTTLTTALGLVTAGLAFALQKVVTAFAGYLVILRGKTFNVGDRIAMGGVRGDVIALGFTQTTIMEMGQPPAVQGADPAMWVMSRQYTGRVVTVSNAKIFDEPVYNYTHEFPFLWEEMSLPIPYSADRDRVERILLDIAVRHAVRAEELDAAALDELKRRYFLDWLGTQPKVYWRLTDNWLELTVRFVVRDRGIRDVKDAMSRDILRQLDAAGIGLASTTFEVVGMPPLRVETTSRDRGTAPTPNGAK